MHKHIYLRDCRDKEIKKKLSLAERNKKGIKPALYEDFCRLPIPENDFFVTYPIPEKKNYRK